MSATGLESPARQQTSSDSESLRLQAHSQRSRSGYIRELDGLRAIAVFCVLLWHYLPADDPVREVTTWGWIGVRLFFVLSGFLITRILLTCRDRADSGRLSIREALTTFYIRRALRIFPVYYLYLGFLLIAQPAIRQHVMSYILYLQNFVIASHSNIGIVPAAGHLWTLAVEEQFYLIWPFLILFLPRQSLLPATFLILLTGPLWRIAFLIGGYEPIGSMVMMPANIDSLGMGAFLATAQWSDKVTGDSLKKLMSGAFLLGAPAFILYLILYRSGYHRLDDGMVERGMFIFADLSGALVYVSLIFVLSVNPPKALSALLCLQPLVYLGRISYGIYLFHVPVPGVLERIFRYAGIGPFSTGLTFVVTSATAVLIAAVSWHFFERPLNDLKKRFEYSGSEQTESMQTVSR